MRQLLARLAGLFALGFLLSTTTPSWAAPEPVKAAKADVVVEEAPDSPRASMMRFVDLANRGKWSEAAAYLDVPRGGQPTAPELARKLDAVLRRWLWLDADDLSPDSLGKRDDGLLPSMDEVGKIRDARGQMVPVRISRREAKDGDEARWVFTASTLSHVPGWYDQLDHAWAREHLPAFLLKPGLKEVLRWQWIAMIAMAIAALFLGSGLSWVTRKVLGVVASKTRPTWDDKLVANMGGPIALGWALVLVYFAVPDLGLYPPAAEFVGRLLKAIAFVAMFWALVRLVIVIGETVAESSATGGRPSVRALAGLGMRAGRIIVIALGTVAVLSELGYPVASLIAGLGIGGVALALAAQKTVEHLLGSIAILADQPFRVGDTIKVDGIEGTVETIGLRSTRLRTPDRTLIIIPNGKLADMRIESLAPRDRFRLNLRLGLPRDVQETTVKAVLAKVTDVLAKHDMVSGEDIFVRVVGFGESSLDIEVNAFIDTLEYGRFAAVREELLLRFHAAIVELGTRLAFPTRLVHVSSDAEQPSKRQAPEARSAT